MVFGTGIGVSEQGAVQPSQGRYPSYKSFDEFIDIERLRSLDAYLVRRCRIRRHIQEDQDDFFVNEHVLDLAAPYTPGVREIWLSRTLPGTPYNYLDIDRPHLWSLTEEAGDFTLLMEFIATLPFESTGRILLIYDEGGRSVPAHRDHEEIDICQTSFGCGSIFASRSICSTMLPERRPT